jgi:hypothetical protein
VPLRSRPYKRVSLRETCRQLVEQASDGAARRHRNYAENVLRVEFGKLGAVTVEVIAHLAFCGGWPSAMWAAQANLMPIEIGKS